MRTDRHEKEGFSSDIGSTLSIQNVLDLQYLMTTIIHIIITSVTKCIHITKYVTIISSLYAPTLGPAHWVPARVGS